MMIGVRVDSSPLIGRGHLMRCLVLANEAKIRGHQVIFLTREHDTIQYLNSEEYVCLEIKQGINHEIVWLSENLETLKLDVLVVDHYELMSRDLGPLMKGTCKIVLIDDLRERPLMADLIISPGLKDISSSYDKLNLKNCKILSGSKFFLLRKDLREGVKREQDFMQLNSVLITSGSTDLTESCYRIAEVLLKNDRSINVIMLVGKGFKNVSYYYECFRKYENLRWVCNDFTISEQYPFITFQPLETLYSYIDGAFTSAGTSALEMVACQIPIVAYTIVENQKNNYEELVDLGLAIPIAKAFKVAQLDEIDILKSYSELAQSERRKALTSASRGIIDGQGARRLIDEIEELVSNA